mgnify:CR=1 FL=1
MFDALKIGGRPDVSKVGWLEIGGEPGADWPYAVMDVYRSCHSVFPHEIVELQLPCLDQLRVDLHLRSTENFIQFRVVRSVAIGRGYRVVRGPDQRSQPYAYSEAGDPLVFPGDQTWPESSIGNVLYIDRDADIFPVLSQGLAGLNLGGRSTDGRGQRDTETISITCFGQHLLGQFRVVLVVPIRVGPGFVAHPVPQGLGPPEA